MGTVKARACLLLARGLATAVIVGTFIVFALAVTGANVSIANRKGLLIAARGFASREEKTEARNHKDKAQKSPSHVGQESRRFFNDKSIMDLSL
ncbi:MAG: hypothetical protein AAFR72_13470, partial [Pseudomonadota bacterium]